VNFTIQNIGIVILISVFFGHKVFGPTGIGALYGKPEVFDDIPAKFEAGTGQVTL